LVTKTKKADEPKPLGPLDEWEKTWVVPYGPHGSEYLLRNRDGSGGLDWDRIAQEFQENYERAEWMRSTRQESPPVVG